MTDKPDPSNKKIRVLMDSQAFDMQTHGGISRCFAELITRMPEDISLCLPIVESQNVYLREKGLAPDRDYYMEFCNGHPTPVKRFWYKLSTNVKEGHWKQWDRMPRLSQIETEQRLAKGEFDVFHPTYYDTYFLSKIGNKPFVLTVHDMIAELYTDTYKFRDGQLQWKRKLIPLASHIIAVSEQTKQDIVRIFDVAPEKISVIYHGTDPKPYMPSPEGNQYGRYVLYVGGRNKYKNFSLFVRDMIPVLRNHPELSVICTGKPFHSEELRMLQDYGLKERYIHEYVETEQKLMDLYHYAQAFVFPSEYEGFGIPILEAYKADCPVLLNRASCFPEVAGDAAVYFSFDKDVRSLQDSMEEVLAWTPAQREELLARQRQRLRRYSWDKSARELADIYREVVSK